MTIADIRKDFRQKKYYPIYFLQGSETYFIDQVANFLEDRVLQDTEKEFNQLVLYGNETSVAEIVSLAKTLSYDVTLSGNPC